MSIPTTTNKTVDEVNELLKEVENVCVPLIENAIIAAVPALGLPIVKQLSEEIEQILANYLTKWAEEQADFTVIDLQTGNEQSKVSIDIKNIQADEASGNTTQLTKDETQYAKDQSALANDDGAGTLQ